MSDFKTDDTGDLVIEGGDLATVDETTALSQKVSWLLKTELFGYAPNPEEGAGLDQFRGQPNSRALGAAVERAAVRALLSDGTIPPDAVLVRAVPTDVGEITLYVFVTPPFTGTGVQGIRKMFTIDLNTGDITTVTGETR